MLVKRFALFALALVILLLCLFLISRSTSFQLFGELYDRAEVTDKRIAMTFDDGPWNKAITRNVLAELADLDIPATFFVNGKAMQDNPGLAGEIVNAGHQLGNHSFSHRRMVLMSQEDIAWEVEQTSQLIRAAGYQGEIFFRPPYGKKLFMLPWYLASHDIRTVTWDVAPETYGEPSAKESENIVKKALEKVQPGSIILLHVMGKSNETSRNAIRPMVEALKAQGYQFVGLSELLPRASPRQ